jgi:hypothetical protein
MDKDNEVNAEEEWEMENGEFMECQCLVIRVSSLGSIVTLSLDTLAQHRVLMG